MWWVGFLSFFLTTEDNKQANYSRSYEKASSDDNSYENSYKILCIKVKS